MYPNAAAEPRSDARRRRRVVGGGEKGDSGGRAAAAVAAAVVAVALAAFAVADVRMSAAPEATTASTVASRDAQGGDEDATSEVAVAALGCDRPVFRSAAAMSSLEMPFWRRKAIRSLSGVD